MTEQSRSPTLAELLQAAMTFRQERLHTSLPGRIETYDPATQTADVQPLIQRTLVASDGTELDPESLPILHDVPVAFPRGGGFYLTWPLQAGDLVHLIFVERSTDQYRASGGEETRPLDFRMHSLADAVAYPGFYPSGLALSDAHPENAVLGAESGAQIHVRPDGEVHLASNDAADYVALAGLVKDELEALQTKLNALTTLYNSHIHVTTATVGAGTVPGVISATTSQATAPAAVGDVAASKVKAD